MDDSRISLDQYIGPFSEDRAREGARNLLVNAANIKKGADLLIVHSDDNVVDPRVTEIIAAEARKLGARVHILYTPPVDRIENLSPVVKTAFENADYTLFHHRVSAQLRLLDDVRGGTMLSTYCGTPELLGSMMARVNVQYWRELLKMVQGRINKATSWRIQCPDGTDITGTIKPKEKKAGPRVEGETFATISFPPGVWSPIDNLDTKGKLTLRYFTNSAVHFDNPAEAMLSGPVSVTVEDGRFTSFSGDPKAVDELKSLLGGLGEKWGKEPFMINSWHSGMNAACIPPEPMTHSLAHWMHIAHSHPRVVHFHTVGVEPPGEITAINLDPTITFDDEVMWKDGRLVFAEKPEVREALKPYGDPDLAASLTPVMNS